MQTSKEANVEEILINLSSNESKIRDSAEAMIESSFKNNPDSFVSLLTNVMCHSTKQSARYMSILILRRRINHKEHALYHKLSDINKINYRNSLIHSLKNETHKGTRCAVESAIANIAEVTLPNSQFPELLPFLENCTKNSSKEIRCSAYLIFGRLSETKEFMDNHSHTIKKILINGLKDFELTVQITTVESMLYCLESMESSKMMSFSDLIPFVLEVLSKTYKTDDEELKSKIMEALVEIMSIASMIIVDYLDSFVDAMVQIGTSRNSSIESKTLSLEFLVLAAEGSSALLRKSHKFVNSSFYLAITLMLNLPEDPNWANILNDEDEEEDELYSEGEIAMDRLATSFGSERTIKVAIPIIKDLLSKPNWVSKYVGLMSISQIVESVNVCHMDSIVKTVLRFLKDNDPRVNYAAAHCIGQMCDDFSPDIQNCFHKEILSGLCSLIVNSNLTKVKAHALAAMVNFVDDAEKDVLIPYLPEIIPSFYKLLSNSEVAMQEQIITLISTVANSGVSGFENYLEAFIPFLIEKIINLQTKEDTLFRFKCVECISFIGMLIDKNKFKDVAHKLMEITISEIESYKDDYVYYDYILLSWARVCSSLKKDFAKYLPSVMPFILNSCGVLAENKENNFSNRDVLDENGIEDDIYIPNLSNIDELESAISTLSLMPADLGSSFLPYIDKTIINVLPLLKYWADDNIRSSAISSLYGLLKVVVDSLKEGKINSNFASKIIELFVTSLYESVEDEKDVSIKSEIVNTMIKILKLNESLSLVYLSKDDYSMKIVNEMMKTLGVSQNNIKNNILKRNSEDYDEEVEKEIKQDNYLEKEILYKCPELIGTIMKITKDRFSVILNSLSNKLITTLENTQSDLYSKAAALFIIDDAIEYIPNLISPAINKIIPILFRLLNLNDFDIKQAVIYGIGISSENFKEAFKPFHEMALSSCLNIFKTVRNNTDEDSIGLSDNAASSYGKIIIAHSDIIDLKKSFPIWLQMLPIKNDINEAIKSNIILCRALKSQNKFCLGENYENLSNVIKVVIPSVGTERLSDESLENLKTFLSIHSNNLPNQMKSEIKKIIPQSVINKIL